jgi:hypothetical protein
VGMAQDSLAEGECCEEEMVEFLLGHGCHHVVGRVAQYPISLIAFCLAFWALPPEHMERSPRRLVPTGAHEPQG